MNKKQMVKELKNKGECYAKGDREICCPESCSQCGYYAVPMYVIDYLAANKPEIEHAEYY